MSDRKRKKFFFTTDVDWIPGSTQGVLGLCEFSRKHDVDCAFFYAGKFIEAYPEVVRETVLQGFEVGTHGWAHGQLEKDEDEDFLTASEADQRRWIADSTLLLEQCTGVRPRIFRAPNLRISTTTFRILEQHGYQYDSSMPAARITLGYSKLNSWSYFWAPREPYHPARHAPGQAGDSPIIEVPPSTFGLPINMSALRVFGFGPIAAAMRACALVSDTLVFYSHPAEFVPEAHQQIPASNPGRHKEGLGPQNFDLVARVVDLARSLGYSSARYEGTTVS